VRPGVSIGKAMEQLKFYVSDVRDDRPRGAPAARRTCNCR
jgi:hypothetical protein